MCQNDYESIISKLKKLKALADGGMPNEKESAANKFNLLLEKYNIDISELVKPDILEREIPYPKDKDACQILSQVIWSISGEAKIFVIAKKKRVCVKLSYTEYIESIQKFKYYWKLYKKQRDLFRDAFIQKNRLYSDVVYENHVPVEISETERKELLAMMMSLSKGEYISTKKIIEK